MLEIKNLMVFYENALAVNNINMRVRKGNVTGVFGANSAGKSTLMYTISGIILDVKKKEAMKGGERITVLGTILYEDADITHLKPSERARRGIILCPERRRIFPESSALATFPNVWVDQYLILGMVVLSLFVMRRLVNEDFGLILRAIKDNDQAVKASGLSVTAYKTKAVFIAALMGCFGGAYLSHLYGWIGISQFAMDFSILPIAGAVMGGMGTLVGPVLGAFILTPMSEALRGFGQLRVVLYCLILIGFIVYKPEGLMNTLQRKYHQFEHWEEV